MAKKTDVVIDFTAALSRKKGKTGDPKNDAMIEEIVAKIKTAVDELNEMKKDKRQRERVKIILEAFLAFEKSWSMLQGPDMLGGLDQYDDLLK